MPPTKSTTTTTNNSLVHATNALAFAAAPHVYSQINKKKRSIEEINDEHASLPSILRGGSQLRPPFPQAVRDMLSKCRLAYLSTVDMANASSHLSLMRFTYLNDAEDGEVVIMSTNNKTKKFGMLQQQKGMALLVHDFQQGGNDAGVYSITLNGECRIVSETKKAEVYRQAHLAHNPDYPQFIVGEDIAILCVDVTSARICDISDRVTKWDIAETVAARSSAETVAACSSAETVSAGSS
jgi:hypothetical protein